MNLATKTHSGVEVDAMAKDMKERHKASLDEVLSHVEQTLRAIKPKRLEAKKDIAVRRWVITLGILILNVGRSISRLVDTDDAVAIMVLARCVYEYRVKAQYFLKDRTTRRLAFDQFMTMVTAYVRGLRRLPTLTPSTDVALTTVQEAWLKSGGKADVFSGKRGVTTMALELTPPNLISVDPDGDRYSAALTTSYEIPSWFVHGSAPVIAEFFSRWDEDDDWDYSTTPRHHSDVQVLLRSVIADIYLYVHFVRKFYKLETYSLGLAIQRAKDLMPPETRRRLQGIMAPP